MTFIHDKLVMVTSSTEFYYCISMQVEGSIVHIMKALAYHPTAALSLIEDDSLQLLFQMVANGSLIVFARYKEGLVPLHSIQLHRHAMQVTEQYVSCSIFSQSFINSLLAPNP